MKTKILIAGLMIWIMLIGIVNSQISVQCTKSSDCPYKEGYYAECTSEYTCLYTRQDIKQNCPYGSCCSGEGNYYPKSCDSGQTCCWSNNEIGQCSVGDCEKSGNNTASLIAIVGLLILILIFFFLAFRGKKKFMCKNCGNELSKGSLFCSNCGEKIDK